MSCRFMSRNASTEATGCRAVIGFMLEIEPQGSSSIRDLRIARRISPSVRRLTSFRLLEHKASAPVPALSRRAMASPMELEGEMMTLSRRASGMERVMIGNRFALFAKASERIRVGQKAGPKFDHQSGSKGALLLLRLSGQQTLG